MVQIQAGFSRVPDCDELCVQEVESRRAREERNPGVSDGCVYESRDSSRCQVNQPTKDASRHADRPISSELKRRAGRIQKIGYPALLVQSSKFKVQSLSSAL